MSEASVIANCKSILPNNTQTLTVGDVFHLECEGEWPTLKMDQLSLQVKDEDKYKIKVLKIEFVTKDKADLSVTSYMVGQHKLEEVKLTDGTASVDLKNVEFNVRTVITQQPPPEKPYGAMGPLYLHFPLWYWGALAGFLLLLALIILLRIRRVIQRRRLIEGLKVYDSPLAPLFQLSRELRRIQRQYALFTNPEQSDQSEAPQIVDDLEKYFRIYLIREFTVPAFDWSDRVVLTDIKKRFSDVYEVIGSDLQKFLNEFKKARQAKNKITGLDCIQLVHVARKISDQVQVARTRKVSGGAR